jgi:drug/metabolite transporter (DMT)-like permease
MSEQRVLSVRDLLLANGALLMMTFTWGAFFPILEHLLTKWDVYSATLGRQVCGMIVLAVCVFARRGREPLPRVIPWHRILILGGIGVSMGSLMTSIGVLFSDGLSSAIISTTNPISAALTASILYREPWGRGLVLATIISVIGGVISVLGDRPLADLEFRGGEILIVLANVTWTWMSMAAQRWLKGFSQLQITLFTVSAGAFWLLILLPFVAVSGIVRFKIDLGVEALSMILFAGVLPIAIGNFFWHYGVSRVGIVVASMYNNLLPAAALATTVFLGGTFTFQQIIGCTIILAGVSWAQLMALRRKRAL